MLAAKFKNKIKAHDGNGTQRARRQKTATSMETTIATDGPIVWCKMLHFKCIQMFESIQSAAKCLK